jgi:hypothetical protein
MADNDRRWFKNWILGLSTVIICSTAGTIIANVTTNARQDQQLHDIDVRVVTIENETGIYVTEKNLTRSLKPLEEKDVQQDKDIERLYRKMDENQKEIIELIKKMK